MTDNSSTKAEQLRLPRGVVSKIDLAHLVAEFEKLDSELDDSAIRKKAGVQTDYAPAMSAQLTDFLALNQLGVDDSEMRDQTLASLRQLKAEAPVMHVTFAATADQESLAQVVDWFRQSIHPHCLLSVGLQPGLVGGAFIRTTNSAYDLSLRAQLANSRHLLVEAVEAVNASK